MPLRPKRALRDLALPALVAALLLPAAPRAAGDGSPQEPPREVLRLAHGSVDARFIPDPKDPERDAVTGRERSALEDDAVAHYHRLLREDPDRFERMKRRLLTEESAESLTAHARRELVSGRPVSAEMSWRRVAEEHPQSPQAGPSLVHLGGSLLEAGERSQAAAELARLPELDLESAMNAAPLMARLLAEVEADLAREGEVGGKDRLKLHDSVEDPGLDRARELSEWISGWALVDEIARTLRMETSGDLLRKVKNVGADDLVLNKIVRLVPLEERVEAIRVEESLRDGSDQGLIEARVLERTRGNKLEHLEDLARLQQLQVVLLARALESMVLEPPARRLGETTWAARKELVRRLEALLRQPADSLTPEERAVTRLVRLADVNGDGKLNPLRDDKGLWRPKRMAVEGDMRNAVYKKLDDDNKRSVADLFERMGTTEKALLHALVRACLDDSQDLEHAAPRVAPEHVDQLVERLYRRGLPAWTAANPDRHAPEEDEVELDYLARLNVLRLPGEGLDDVLCRFVLEPASSTRTGGNILASDPRAAVLVAELAALGSRWQGAWLFEDAAGGGPSAAEKFERAQAIRLELDDLAASRALVSLADSLVADLESQGLRFDQADVELVKQRIQHEDLGTLAMIFGEDGHFSGLQDAFAFSEPGTKLGDYGPGHLAYGFGLDLQDPAPGASVGWRGGKQMRDGDLSLRYHVGATGISPDGLADTAGVAARFRQRKVWQPEIGADASILRGFAGRGFLNLIRDVNLIHQRKLVAIFAEHEAAKAGGREAFVDSISAEGAQAKPALLFLESLGYEPEDFLEDTEAWVLLHDQYEFEKQRQRSLLNRKAWKLRFAGVGVTAGFFAGEVYLLAGPKLAVKDYRLFSRFVDGPDRRTQAEEARMRRVTVPSGPTFGRGERRTVTTELAPSPASDGTLRFARLDRETERSPLPLPSAPEGRDDWPLDLGPAFAAERDLRLASERGTEEFVRYASLEPTLSAPPGEAQARQERGLAREQASLDRINEALVRHGIPLRLAGSDRLNQYRLEPKGLTPWASQSVELYVSEEDGLGLALGEDGLPLLVAPFALDGIAIDWLEEVRGVTRAGESDEVHRVCLSRAPGRSADVLIESSAWFLRTEIVGGEVIGTARIATRFRDAAGRPVVQANVVDPRDGDAEERLTALRVAAAKSPCAELPELPPAPLFRAARVSDGTLWSPLSLSPDFLHALRSTSADELREFKQRSLAHSAARAASEPGSDEGLLDPENVSYLQELSLAHHGRLLSGEALAHADFVLTHEGLYRADGGPITRQVAHLRERALSPFGDGRELSGAPDARTRRLLELAGIDEASAREVLQGRVRAMAVTAERTGVLPRQALPRGTRIVTASQSGTYRGVQWTTATEAIDAHLLDPLSLFSNEGRYVAALALGPDLPALDLALREELELRGERSKSRFDLDEDLLPAIALALAEPESESRLHARLPGGVDLVFSLAEAPLAGALARCKNATLFPPAYGARLQTRHDVLLASGPVTTLGVAEADTRFVGESWVGWRRLNLLGGLPFGGDDDPKPEPDPIEPPREGVVPPGGGRRGGEPPDRPVNETPVEVDPPRDGDVPPSGGGRGGTLPDRPVRDVPVDEPVPPRTGEEPPGGGGGERPNPPDPPDRPRRPVD